MSDVTPPCHVPQPGDRERHVHRGLPPAHRLRRAGIFTLAVVMCLGLGAGLAAITTDRPSVGTPTAPVAAGAVPVADSVGRMAAPRGRNATVASAAQPYPDTAPVLLVGDSLAVGIETDLDAAWPNRTMTVDAEIGRSTPTQVALLSSYANSSAPVWVVSLGTNDSPDTFPDAAASIVRLAGPQRCLVWFNVHRPTDATPINDELQQLAARHQNVHVIDWTSVAAANPQWFGYDGIHPSTEGYQQRARLATSAVDQWCTRP